MKLLGMSDDLEGSFTANLISLQLQLKTLLDDAGGDAVVRLLDSLCKLSSSEQRLALGIFDRVIGKLIAGDIRLSSQHDRDFAELEETLYQDVLRSMREAAGQTQGVPKLELLKGGERGPASEKRPIDLGARRRKKQQ